MKELSGMVRHDQTTVPHFQGVTAQQLSDYKTSLSFKTTEKENAFSPLHNNKHVTAVE